MTLRGAAALQWALLRRSPGDLIVLVNTPLLTLMLVAIVRHADRPDLAHYAVLAPGVMAVWNMALVVSGEIVAQERSIGSLELLVSSPARLPVVIFGRIAVVTMVSLISVAESWLAAWLAFGLAIEVPHPVLFAMTLAATGVAMAGTATAMAAVFVLTRSARTFQNALSYPFFVLGGALVPIALLPDWLRPVARVVFLSWCSDLLRDALSRGPVDSTLLRLGVVLVLAGVGYLVGGLLLVRLVDRVRANGSIGLA